MVNGLNNPIQIFIHFIIPEPKHFEASSRELRIPFGISYEMANFTMLSTIDFDNELRLQTCEIDDKTLTRHSPTKMEALVFQSAQMDPEFTSCGVMTLRSRRATSFAITSP